MAKNETDTIGDVSAKDTNKKAANEFIIKKGVSAWDDINSDADDEWAKETRELLAAKK